VQAKGGRHYKWVIRAWGERMRSRRIAYGVARTIEELKELAKAHRVPWRCVAFDSSAYTAEVYGYVVESGGQFKALKGDDRTHYMVAGEERIFQLSSADPAIGTVNEGKVAKIPLWVWAKYGALDRLMAMMHGYMGQWEIPEEDEDEDYALEVTAMGQRSVTNRAGTRKKVEWYHKRDDDHFCDCEQMQIVCAASTNLLSPPPPPPPKKGDEGQGDLPLNGVN
jgi:hypothetical protein